MSAAVTTSEQTGGTFDENQRLGLVCAEVPDRQEAIKAALEQLGYTVRVAAGAPDAIDGMRKDPYEVVVLDQEFQAEPGAENPVLQALRTMPMSVRRYIFVALIGQEYKTLDNMTAFARSVNLVISLNDLAQLAPILKRGVADNAQFYRVFREVLQEVGKR